MAKEIFIPKLGQTMEEVTLLNWQVKDGDTVEKGQAILDVETDKAVFPVESTASGIVHLGPFQPGQVIPVLEVVAVVGTKDDAFRKITPAPAAASDEIVRTQTPADQISQQASDPVSAPVIPETVFISPRAKKLAIESHIDWSRIQPTGDSGNRIIERDVIQYLVEKPRVSPLAEKIAGKTGIDLHLVQGAVPAAVL